MTSSASSEASLDDNSKISAAFASRLGKLEPSEQIRAIVLPALTPAPERDGAVARAARAPARREATADALAAQNREMFAVVDNLLEAAGGRRLTRIPNRLGYILVEATVAAIHALAALDCVAAIIEDQPFGLLHPFAGHDLPM